MIINILVLIAGIISLALAGIVLAEGKNTKNLRTAYALFAGGVGIWAIFLALFLLIDSPQWAAFTVPIFYSVGLLIPYGFLLFCFAYLSIGVSKGVKFFALLPWTAMTIIIVTPTMMIGNIDAGSLKTVQLIEPAYLLYSMIFIVYVLLGAWFLVTKAANAKGLHSHRRIVALSLIVGFLGGGYFDIILPLIGNYQLIAYGALFAFVTSAGIFYVIARHGLFDIRLTVVRTINYILSLSVLGLIYLFVAYVVFNVLLKQDSSSAQLFFNLGLTIMLALLFQPVKHFFDRWTNKFFYRHTYDTNEVFEKLNRLLSSTTDLQRLLSSVSEYLAESLNTSQVFFFVYTNEERSMSAGTQHHTKLPLADASWLNAYVEANGSSLLRYDAEEMNPLLRRLMVSHRIKIIVPLVKSKVVIGYLCLGEHQKNDYTIRDIRLLETISNELVIAIENALSIHEVRDLNAHLEQRIDAATKELRRSNAQLQRLDEAKDEFISMASHQLRTPLTSIKGYLSMLIEGDLGEVTKDQKHVLNEAFISSERMVRLIGDFLNVSRLQTGKFVIDKHSVDLAQLVQRELEALESNAAARGMKFVYKKPKNIPTLELDENKIEQVVMNFADNAIYYAKEESKIVVSLKKVGDFVEFTVKDTGIGVPKSDQAHLFTKFYRASNARKARPDGTGVGLFLAKKVIDDHGGSIIFSSIEGKGSTFGFKLPIPKTTK